MVLIDLQVTTSYYFISLDVLFKKSHEKCSEDILMNFNKFCN